ncbi:MAG: zinc-binding dehydrogenase [Verrucomicrobiota bacterium JB024]|nr:zinc-binding dehydrogenase [Verrucomicrobiota bacterium JB024]
MKAAVIVSHGQVEIQDIAPPKPGPYEALVKIEACGLCGTTDRHIVDGHQAHHPADWYPAVLGHEAVGTVIEVGDKVRKFAPGDRVTRPVAIWPGTQREGLFSAWGGFAEYGIVRDDSVPGGPEEDYTSARQQVLPSALSVEDAVAAISLAEVASWSEKLGKLDGQTVVIGGTGFAACVMAQCARTQGAAKIIAFGRSPKKFDWVRRNGATHTLTFDAELSAAVREINGGLGADWFLDAAGHQQVFEAGLKCLRPGGSAAIYGAPDGFAYTLPLGAVGGDFCVKYLSPTDDSFMLEACQRILDGRLDAAAVRTHIWDGLESLNQALKEQAAGEVLKGMVRIS